MNKGKLKISLRNNYMPYIFLGILVFIWHIFVKVNFGDDVTYFKGVINRSYDGSVVNYIYDRYLTWTSRIIIEPIMIFLLDINIWVWKVLDTLVYVLIAKNLAILVNDKNEYQLDYIICALVAAYPISTLFGTGWLAVSLNYVWPLMLALFVLTLFKKIMDGKEIKVYQLILYVLASIFAFNQEQTVMLMTVYIIIFLGVIIWKKKYNKSISIILGLEIIIAIAQLLFSVLSPGNNMRSQYEILWRRDFGMFSLIERIYLSFNITMKEIFTNKSIGVFFVILLFFTTYLVFQNYKSIIIRLISIIPVVSFLLITFNEYFLKYNFIVEIDVTNYDSIKCYLFIAIVFIVIGCLAINIYLLYPDSSKIILFLIVLGMGLASRVVLGISPTLYNPVRDQTYIFMQFSIIYVIVAIYRDFKVKMSLCENAIFTFIIFEIFLYFYVNTIYSVLQLL